MDKADATTETRLSVRLQGPLALHADHLVESSIYSSHSEYIRDLVRRDMMSMSSLYTSEDEQLRQQIIDGYGQLARGEYREVSVSKIWNRAMDKIGKSEHKISE